MPVFVPDQTYAPNRFGINDATPATISHAITSSRHTYGGFETAAKLSALGITDFVDSIASSIPGANAMLGIERGQLNQAFLNAMDMPRLTNFYSDYKGGVEAISGIGGIIASELLTRKITAPAGLFMQGLSKIPFARRIASLDNEYYDAMAVVRGVDRNLASRGALGYEQFVGRVNVMDLGEGVDAARRLGITGEIARNVARGGALKRGFISGAVRGAEVEAVLAIGFNQNGFLYHDSAAYNTAFTALGVLGGGAIERVHAAYSIRKFVNTDEIRRSFSNALDPDKSEQARLLGYTGVLNLSGPERETIGFLGGAHSDNIVSLLISHKSLVDTPVTDMGLRSSREKLSTQWLKLAEETANKITTKGITTNGATRFSMDSRGFGNHISMLNKNDAGWAWGLESLGGIPDELTGMGVHLGHQNRLQELVDQLEEALAGPMANATEREAAETMLARTKFEQTHIPVAYIDGEAATLTDLAAFDNWVEPVSAPASKIDDEGTMLWETVTEGPRGVGLDSKLNIYLPNNASLDLADHFDLLRLYRQGQRAIQFFAKGDAELRLPAAANWFQLDIAENVLKINPNAKIVWPKGMTREAAEVESFAQKSEALILQAQKARQAQKKYQLLGEGSREDAFKSIANQQRGAPEAAMTKVQTTNVGGVLNPVVEHVGDLLHRMTEYGGETLAFGRGAVQEKLARELKRLKDPNFLKEMESNFANNAKYRAEREGTPFTAKDLKKEVFAAMDEYAAEHAKLPTYNKVQTLARDAAVDVGKRNWKAAIKKLEELQRLSQDEKAWMEAAGKFPTKGKARGAAPLDEEQLASQMRLRYNLPRLTAYERGVLGETVSPIESLMRGAEQFGIENIRGMHVTELKEAVAQYKRIGDLQPVSAKDIESLSGSSFRFLLDDQGVPIKAMLGYKRPLRANEWAKDRVEERLAQRQMYSIGQMTNHRAAPVTKGVIGAIISNADYHTASQTHELMETQIQGLFGSSHLNTTGALGKSVITREMRDRDNPINLAASRLQQTVANMMRGALKAISESSGLTDSIASLNSPRNTSSKLLLSQFHSFRPGWDLHETIVDKIPTVSTVERTAPDGSKLYAFLLDRTDKNQERWRQFFGSEMPEGQTLMGPNGKEVTLDDMGMGIQQSFNNVTEAHRAEQNTLLRAQGLKEIGRVPMFVPSPQVEGKYIGFVMDEFNEIVPYATIVANTMEEFERQKRVLFDSAILHRKGNVFRTRDEVKEFMSIWDRAQMDMIDPGTTAIQSGKPNRGALSGIVLDTASFDHSLSVTRDRFLDHGNDIIYTLMKNNIDSAKARSNVSTGVTRNRTSQYRDQKYRSIHDLYQENLLGKSGLAASGSPVGRLYNNIEGTLDGFLTSAGPPVAKTGKALGIWLDKARIWDKSDAARRDFDSLSTHLGEWMPFKTAHDYAQSHGAGSMPPTLAGLVGGVNRFTAAMMLRVAEMGHPIVNLGGIMASSPAVIRHLMRRANETIEEHAARVGHSASIFELGDGKSVTNLDIMKIASRALKSTWNVKSHVDLDHMVRNGFITQEVAELHKQFGAIKSKSDLERFFMGDPAGEMILGKKGLVGWMSVLTDKSEDFSRTWGHMIGLEMADMLGVKGLTTRHNFAHDIANKMIANYSPHNRPEIFQGAVGAPLGLFQSFIQNYYQRIFRYIETKDYRTLATQYATQAGFFGITGVPGWSLAQSMFFHESEGDVDINDVQARFGKTLGDLLSGGVISNIPKLFSGEAVDLYSRGDVNARLPHSFTATPSWVMGEKIWSAMSDGYRMFMAENPDMSMQAIAEIAANAMPNRPIAGMIEQALAGGYDVDQYGQVVTNTKTGMEIAFRTVGLRSMRQSQELQAFYSNKTLMEMKSSQDEILRLATRSAIRGGNYDALPKIAEQYLSNGGDPRYFKRWLRSNYEAAKTSRGERQLDEMLNDPEKMGMVARLLDAGVSISQDESTTSYDSLTSDSVYAPTAPLGVEYNTNQVMDATQQLPTVP